MKSNFETTPKSFHNHKTHKANIKVTKKKICITALCARCEITLHSL